MLCNEKLRFKKKDEEIPLGFRVRRISMERVDGYGEKRYQPGIESRREFSRKNSQSKRRNPAYIRSRKLVFHFFNFYLYVGDGDMYSYPDE